MHFANPTAMAVARPALNQLARSTRVRHVSDSGRVPIAPERFHRARSTRVQDIFHRPVQPSPLLTTLLTTTDPPPSSRLRRLPPARMLPTVLVAAVALASRTSALPLTADDGPSATPDVHPLGWDISLSPSAWFESNRQAILAHHDLALQTRSSDADEDEDDGSVFSKRNWQIPTSGLPPLPLTYWLLSNSTSLPILANAAVRRMQTWWALLLPLSQGSGGSWLVDRQVL